MKLSKYTQLFCLLVSLFFSLSLLSGCSSDRDFKGEIFTFAKENASILLSDVETNDFSESLSFDGIEYVKVLHDGCVNFYWGGYGLSTSSHEFGFYYSPDDQPLAVWEDFLFATCDDLSPDGVGFAGSFQHNSYYTEKICDHLWYYELHF